MKVRLHSHPFPKQARFFQPSPVPVFLCVLWSGQQPRVCPCCASPSSALLLRCCGGSRHRGAAPGMRDRSNSLKKPGSEAEECLVLPAGSGGARSQEPAWHRWSKPLVLAQPVSGSRSNALSLLLTRPGISAGANGAAPPPLVHSISLGHGLGLPGPLGSRSCPKAPLALKAWVLLFDCPACRLCQSHPPQRAPGLRCPSEHPGQQPYHHFQMKMLHYTDCSEL